MASPRRKMPDPAPGRLLCGVLVALLLIGCASAPPRTVGHEPVAVLGQGIARSALEQVGHAYRYGAAGPEAFDCSGLVHYTHALNGLRVPRTTGEQFASAIPVDETAVRPGDLLFFRFEQGPKVTHVGIYVGEGRFVHAPQSGRSVEVRRLDDSWYRRRMAGAGRLY